MCNLQNVYFIGSSFSLMYLHIYHEIMKSSLTFASWSNLPNSSLRSLTNSWAVHCEASTVNPTISANNILKQKVETRNTSRINLDVTEIIFKKSTGPEISSAIILFSTKKHVIWYITTAIRYTTQVMKKLAFACGLPRNKIANAFLLKN